MNKVLKFIGYSIVTILAGLGLLIIIIGDKDIPREQLKTKYAKSPSTFIPLMVIQVHYRDERNK